MEEKNKQGSTTNSTPDMALHETPHQERGAFSASISCKHEYRVAAKLILISEKGF